MVEDSKEAEKELISSQQHQQLNYTRKSLRNEDFTRTIAKIAVAQICENEGFQGFHQSALEALSDVAIRYIKELGKASNHYANLSGRSECNVFDLIQGLEDLGFVLGFPGASDVHHSLANSGVIRDIGQYVNFIENVPFVFDVPRFSVCKECKLSPSFSQLGEEPPGEHIPAWLPAFPSAENGKDGSPGAVAVKDEPQEQKLVARDRVQANVNPFLAPPFRYGEKDVAFVEPPTRFLVRNHGDMMEAFGRMSGSDGMPKELSEIEERNDIIMSVERPAVRFKLGIVKKRDEKLASCFSIEEEKDKSFVEEPLKEFSEMRELDST
ncbi:hypothetical protein RND81_03G089100 [Saponaria officinalis]|uniref:Bromodomain associated domain-containing protein n=1 Tax=Saponaria officinalis TaxID=3572 RepID=A0AAW1M296_SAPOF